MLTHKEFYIWLDGYLFGKLENKHIDIAPIVEKMGEVKDEPRIGIAEPYTIPIPVNPFPRRDDPFKPPYEVYCGTNKQDDNSDRPPKNVI
jgi:hypothetical protein